MSFKATRLWAIVVLGILGAAGCSDSDKAASPKLVGAPPANLAGVWAVTDTSTACYPFGVRVEEDVFTDTICTGGPDFGVPNAEETWQMYLQYAGILPGKWTNPVFESCSGVITDTSVQVYCVGRASATVEACDFTVRIYTNGTLDGNHWVLLRKVERIEGEDCGRRHGDSAIYCTRYVTAVDRIGDAPTDCASSDNVVGR